MGRGRKPKEERTGYFYEDEERAFREYLKCEDKDEKDKIYNKWLLPAFVKMSESIIRRYKLYTQDMDFYESSKDAVSFLLTKLDKFNPDSKYKAYSYCGTIIKNYLIYRINTNNKNLVRNTSYEGMYSELSEDSKFVDPKSEDESITNDLIEGIVEEIDTMIKNKDAHHLNDDEVKVGIVLKDVLSNWDEIFTTMGSNKFNKSSVLLYLRETLSMSTSQVRNCMKKYKVVYYALKKKILD